MQWHPKHRALCFIRGWSAAFWGVGTNTTTPFEVYINPSTLKPGYFKIYGGGANVSHISLEWLYKEHKKFHNVWSQTNEGFDLARYFGTNIILWPHPNIDYIFWWETDFGSMRKEDYQKVHPATAILEKHHRIVKSIQNGGRKPKKIRIPPPSVHQSQWYFMKQWCNVALLRYGFSMINLKNPFIKKGEGKPWVIIGNLTSNNTDPNKIPNIVPVASDNNNVWYKYDWDDGEDNKIGWGSKDPSKQQVNQLGITNINIPYWKFWYGAGWQNFNNSWYTYIWWYPDKVNDPPKYAPEDMTAKKQWIWVNTTNKTYAELVVNMCQKAPFVMDQADLPDTNIYNVPFFYVSKWQWGGTSPNPPTTTDPCQQPPASVQHGTVRIEDPATTGLAVLHPWDLDTDGLITKAKLRQLISGTFTDSRRLQREEEAPGKSQKVDSVPSTEESTDCSSSSETWDEETEEDDPKLSSLTKRIYRERKHRLKLKRRLKRLVNS